jgi:hypothetical protein
MIPTLPYHRPPIAQAVSELRRLLAGEMSRVMRPGVEKRLRDAERRLERERSRA